MTQGHKNDMRLQLISLGICNDDSIELFYPKVRDRDDVAVMRCKKSGVIFLSRSDHIDVSTYEEREGFGYWSAQDRNRAIVGSAEDYQRIAKQLQGVVINKKWLDVGTGAGGMLDILSPFALESVGVEPQIGPRNQLLKEGYNVYATVDQLPDIAFDVVTLFHVFEHLSDPLQTLKTISEKMASGGKIVIEVPHANDFLISFLQLDSFKAFTFWSEHLILHTRQSLTIFLEEAEFKNIHIKGHQRYPLANHLYWLAEDKPGGHQTWSFLRTPDLDEAYTQMLAQLDKTDTLIIMAEK